MKKAKWLRNSIAKRDGYYSKSNEKLKSKRLSDADINNWNAYEEPLIIKPLDTENCITPPGQGEAPQPQRKGVFQLIIHKLLGTR